MNLLPTVRPLALAAALSLAWTLPACTSNSGAQRIDNTTTTMSSIESLLDEGETRLDAVITSMDQMEESENLDRSFREFDRNLRNVEDTASKVRSRRVALQANAGEHIIQWRAEGRQITGERAQEISDQRRREFERTLSDVGSELDDLGVAYEPLIAKLRDLRSVLSNDMTRPGIERTRPLRTNAIELAQEICAQSAETRLALQHARTDFAR
jgi:hypothetical protein